MEDREMLDSTMDGKPYKAARLAATLRRRLWREHLGLLPAQSFNAENDPNALPPNDCMNENDEGPEYEFVKDPLDDDLWDTWTGRATTNTEVFRLLFRADPDDNIKTFNDYDYFSPRGYIKQGHLHDPFLPIKFVKEQLERIKGHLVWMPLDFLKDVNMAEPGMSVNQFTEVSDILYTRFYRRIFANTSITDRVSTHDQFIGHLSFLSCSECIMRAFPFYST